jgi:hypothetical protein
MRARTTRLAGAALLLAMTGCAAIEEAGRPSLDTVAQRMPAQLAGFMLGDTARRPGPALALDYATGNRSAVAAILVYDAPGGAAPSNPSSPAIDREVTSAVAEMSEAPYGRGGRRLAERERITIADPGLRCAILTGAFGRAAVVRHVCIGTAQGRFVRIQVTMADRNPPPADATAFASAALRAVRGG